MDKNGKGQRRLEESGAGLLPKVEGLSLEQTRINEAIQAEHAATTFD